MEFDIQTRHRQNIPRYGRDELTIAYEFSKEAKKELKELIRAVVLFGSAARHYSTKEKSNDIDILLVLDDVAINFTQDIIQAYRIIVEKIVSKVSKRLHITSLRFTNFWEYVRAGDPIAINILRDGVPVIDTGFFSPLQIMLAQGRIRPSAESIHNYMILAPQTLFNSTRHIIAAVLDLYWAVIDSAHAALMSINEIPPSPAHAADLIEEKLVKTKLVEKRYAIIMRRFYDLAKAINHGEITGISGAHYDMYYKEAHDFCLRMKKFVDRK